MTSTRLVIGTSRTVGSAKKFVRITSGFGGGEFTKTLRKVCTCQKLKFSRSSKYQFYKSRWFDSTLARTHDLPHSRRANNYTTDVVSCIYHQGETMYLFGSELEARRVHEDTSQGMYMSKIEIFFFTARILQNQRILCCGECFHD
jgi:hypothetical protein